MNNEGQLNLFDLPIEQEVVVKQEDKSVSDNVPYQDPPSYFKSGFDIYQSSYPEHPMLIQDLLPSGIIAVCASSSDVGKSMLWRQAVACIAMGRETFIGKQLNIRYGRAAYISTEDGERMIHKQFRGWELSEEEVRKLDNLDIKILGGEAFPNQQFLNEAVSNPYDLIVVDVLSDTLGADMNDATKVRGYYNKFKYLVNETNTTCLFIHHISKKGEQQAASKVNILGSSAIESASRCVFDLRKDSRNTELRDLVVTKGNYVPENLKNKPYKIRFTDRLWFEETSESGTPLLSTANLKEDQRDELINKVYELSDAGLSQREISKKITEQVSPIGRTRVGEILKNRR